jgi:ketosteroid isomerase-like protein
MTNRHRGAFMRTSASVWCYVIFALAIAALLLVDITTAGESGSVLEADLRAAETAFARTMADRDHGAFTKFLSEEAVFFGRKSTMRGKHAVSKGWARFFDDPDAPFSWEPEIVAVLESGTLGLTSGPVLSPEGVRIGTFNSVWRRVSDGRWEIVFDRGCPPCDCP